MKRTLNELSHTPQTVLFLCTGNYYRSRFAEILFNALAKRNGLDWRAASRGLAIEWGIHNVGPLSDAVSQRLAVLGLALEEPPRMPLQVQPSDLEQATRIIALKEAEHRPLLQERHPTWEARVEYWHVHDLDCAPVEQALEEIELLVNALVSRFLGDSSVSA